MAPLLTPLRPIDRNTLTILNKHLETGSSLVNKHVVDPVLDFVGPVIGGILRGLDNQNMNYSINPESARGSGNATATATVAGNILDLPAKVVAEGAGLLGAGPETKKLIRTAADLLIPTPPVARALKKVKTGAQTLGTITLPKTTSKIPITPSVKPNVTSTNGLTISPQLARRTVANELSDIESMTGLTSSKKVQPKPSPIIKLTDVRTSHVITPEGVKPIYGTKSKGKPVPLSDAHGGIKSPVFHHIIGKKIRLRFQQRMQHLDPQGGKGRLETLDRKYDLEAGSGDKAGMTMDQPAHGRHHDTSRAGGTEPWDTKKGKTLSQLKNMIDNAKTTKELERLYELYLRTSVIPDKAHAVKFQRGYETLGSPAAVNKQDLIKAADEWETMVKNVNETMSDEYLRQTGQYGNIEIYSEQQRLNDLF